MLPESHLRCVVMSFTTHTHAQLDTHSHPNKHTHTHTYTHKERERQREIEFNKQAKSAPERSRTNDRSYSKCVDRHPVFLDHQNVMYAFINFSRPKFKLDYDLILYGGCFCDCQERY